MPAPVPNYTVRYATANDGEKYAVRGRYTHSHHRTAEEACEAADSFVRGSGNGITDGLFAAVTDGTGKWVATYRYADTSKPRQWWAWIDQGDGSVREVVFEAFTIQQAAAVATALCRPGEYHRGVNEVTGTPVRPDYVQVALGELGEALVKDAPACDAHIERAMDLLIGRVTP